MARNVGEVIKSLTALRPQSDSGGSAVNGADVDRLGYQNATFLIQTGAISGSPGANTVTVNVQHATAAGGSYANVSGATGTITAANTDLEINVALQALNQYIRVTETTAFTGGSSPTVLIGSACVLGNFSGTLPV
ncbi:MAG: hypothetical protein ACE5HR_00135 [bacterium]